MVDLKVKQLIIFYPLLEVVEVPSTFLELITAEFGKLIFPFLSILLLLKLEIGWIGCDKELLLRYFVGDF